MKKYLKLIRINHWLKNILVFIPIFFSGNIFEISMLLTCLLAFFVFSFSASIVYIINDFFDIEKDRLHEIKKNRPLASGEISKRKAIYMMLFLAFLMIVGIINLYLKVHNILIIFIPLIYIIINILYSKGLKNVAIIDLIILASGFVLRVVYGGVATNIVVSKYLYLMIIFGSYYLSFGKRRGKIIKGIEKYDKYNKEFLDKNMYVTYGLSIVSYTLWCVDTKVVERLGHDYLFWTVPILMTILQLYSLDIEKDSYGDPVDVILGNKVLFALVIFYAFSLVFLLYII